MVLVVVAALQVLTGAAGYLLGAGQPAPTSATGAAVALATLGLTAAWLIIGGRLDTRAQDLGAFYLVVAAAFARRFLDLVGDRGTTVWTILHAPCVDAFLAFFIWRFVREFPRAVRFSRSDRLIRAIELISLAAGLALFSANLVLAFFPDAPWFKLLGRSIPNAPYWSVLLALALPALPVAWLRAHTASPHERRRVALFSLGLAIAIVPPILEMVSELAWPAWLRAMDEGGRSQIAPIFYGFLVVAPLVTAYAVLVDRVLTVRSAIGRALQYLLARATLVALTGAPFAVLAVYGYLHRTASLADLASGRRAVLLWTLGAASGLLWLVRRRALTAIDRWFFRRELEAAEDLPRVTAALRNTRSRLELLNLLNAEVSRILQTERVTPFVLEADSLVAVGEAQPPLPASAALWMLLSIDSSPVVVSPETRHSPFSLLPTQEQNWVVATDVSVLIPLVASHEHRLGFVAFGRKRSDVPFSREELSFMTSVVSSAALVLEAEDIRAGDRKAMADASNEKPALECVACGRVSVESPRALAEGEARSDPSALALAPGGEVAFRAGKCPCGGSLRSAALPHVVAGKFRVERSVGAGSMGVVYQGQDLGLGRPVALKTLPRLSTGAADRLAHEARVMASVVHPNLATIFGLEHWRDTPILVVEFLEGGTLADRFKRGPCDVDEVLRLGMLLAPALEQLHGSGVLHPTLTPRIHG